MIKLQSCAYYWRFMVMGLSKIWRKDLWLRFFSLLSHSLPFSFSYLFLCSLSIGNPIYRSLFSFQFQVLKQALQLNYIRFPIQFHRKILLEWEAGFLLTMNVTPVLRNGLLACDCHGMYDISLLCMDAWKVINEESKGSKQNMFKRICYKLLSIVWLDSIMT